MAKETTKKHASVTVDIRVPKEIAWRGITDSRELQIWFAQQAHSDLKQGGLYTFSGKHVPFLKYDKIPEQKIIACDSDQGVLEFLWPLRRRDGEIVDTTVKFCVTQMDDYSRLDVDHIVGAEDLTDDDLRNLWTSLLNGYVFHMEGASAWVRPEFTLKRGREFRLEIWIAAKREVVYETLTTVDGIRGFFAPQIKKIELKPGGKLSLGWDTLPVIEVEENEKFVFGWREEAEGEHNLQVCWELKDDGNGTRLMLSEGVFEEPVVFSSRSDFDGWAAMMNDLKRHIETKRHPIFLSILIEPYTEKK